MEQSGDENRSESAKVDNSRSDHLVLSQTKTEYLRSSKSSPQELHHTRSFSEIRHLHPSVEDLNEGLLCTKSKIIDNLKQKVFRPESVLELADLTSEESNSSSDEDMLSAQEKGNEAMKKFMEADINVPLHSALTSDSSSQSSLESDVASEQEMIVGTWDNEGRESISSSGSCTEKQFLTPSGQLLYREQQADSMLDTRRVKMSPSTADRPISPLAAKTSPQTTTQSTEEPDDPNKKVKQKKSECTCGLAIKVKELEEVIDECEVRYDKVMSKQTKQTGELKKLRKDNASLRKEQNRLQVFIKEHSRQGEATQSKITKLLTAKEAHIDELNMMIKDQKKEMKARDEEIVSLKAKLAERTDEVSLYDDIFREITQESSALLGALATHLGQQGDEVTVNLEKDKKALVPLLKKRRDSLQDDFRFFTEHLIQLPSGTQPSALDTKIDQLQASIHDDFDDMTADCKKALSRVQQTGESVKTLQQKACGLEAMLLNPDCKCNTQLPPLPPKIPAKPSEDDLTPQLEALQKELRKEKRSVTSWRIECEHLRQDYTKIVEEKLHLDKELNKRINKVEKEKKEALKKLERLETDFKNRLEKNKQEKKELKTQFETLKESYIANKTKWKEQMAWVLNQEKSNDNRENKMQQTDQPDCCSRKETAEQEQQKYSMVDDCVKQLNELTTTLTTTIENASQQAELLARQKESTDAPTPTKRHRGSLTGGGLLLWELKDIYESHIAGVTQYNQNYHKTENNALREQLLAKERDEEMNKCYMASLQRSNDKLQEELKASKIKCQQMKGELREVKDRLLVFEAKQRMSVYMNNGKTNDHVNQANQHSESTRIVKVEKHI